MLDQNMFPMQTYLSTSHTLLSVGPLSARRFRAMRMNTRGLPFLFCAMCLHAGCRATINAQTQNAEELPLTVAVADFDAVNLDPSEAWLPDAIEGAINELLVRSGSVTVVERRYLARLMDELALQVSGAVSDESSVEIGNLLGASLLVIGSVEDRENTLHVKARILDVETSSIQGIYSASGTLETLSELELDLARQIMVALRLEEGRRRIEESAPLPLPPLLRSGLERAQRLLVNAPIVGLDPGRRRRQSDYMMALDLSERALATHPLAVKAHVIRGIAWLNMGDAAVAAASFQEAVRISPADTDALLGLANAYLVLRVHAKAAEAARQAVELAPWDGRPRYLLGRILLEDDQRVSAAAAMIESLERSPIAAEAETSLRVLLGGVEGQQVLESLETMGGGLVQAARLLQARWEKDRMPDRRDVDAVLRLRPRFYLAHYWAGLYSRKDREMNEAERFLKNSLSLNPSFPLVHRELGRLALEQDRCREGEQHVKLYLQTAEFVDDFDELNQLIERCKRRNPPPTVKMNSF